MPHQNILPMLLLLAVCVSGAIVCTIAWYQSRK